MKFKKPNFAIILFTGKVLANGEHPVMIRATFNRERKYYSLKLSSTPTRWNNESARFEAKRKTEAERQGNHFLDEQAVKLKSFSDYFSKVSFTFERFEQKMFPASNGKVLPYFDTLINSLEKSERLGSARAYKNTRDKLKRFNSNDLTFEDLDKKFLQKFETFIAETCSPATVGIYMRTLRALYNRAIVDNLVTREAYPFTGYSIKIVKARKKALTREQLETLKNYEAVPDSKQWHSLNLFMFSYYGRGMNLSDMASLRWDDVRNGRIFYKRQKTGDLIDLPLDDKLATILHSYKTNDFIFPILQDGLSAKTSRYRIHAKLKQINQDLNEIALSINDKKFKEEGIENFLPDDITFYWARHSFATALKRGGVSIAVISETLGHSSEAVTKNYLDSFSTDQLDEISKHL